MVLSDWRILSETYCSSCFVFIRGFFPHFCSVPWGDNYQVLITNTFVLLDVNGGMWVALTQLSFFACLWWKSPSLPQCLLIYRQHRLPVCCWFVPRAEQLNLMALSQICTAARGSLTPFTLTEGQRHWLAVTTSSLVHKCRSWCSSSQRNGRQCRLLSLIFPVVVWCGGNAGVVRMSKQNVLM